MDTKQIVTRLAAIHATLDTGLDDENADRQLLAEDAEAQLALLITDLGGNPYGSDR
jgi:hypothetical protein